MFRSSMSIINNVLSKVLGSHNDRLIKKYKSQVNKINSLEGQIKSLSDGDLSSMTEKLKARLKDNESEESVLPEAFAVVREASQRTLGLRHYDVQLIGGMVLNEGSISEMGTGEGKTLVATLPAYLNAISGKRVHIVTVNDYLASRDAEWMGRVFSFLGLAVGTSISGMSSEENKKPTPVISHMQQTTSLGLTIFETIWLFLRRIKCRRSLRLRLLMRSTQF